MIKKFQQFLRTWKPIHLCWLFKKYGWKIPKYFIGNPDSEGPNSPDTMADDDTVGTVAWTNPDNAKVSDNVYATVTLSAERSHKLKATNFGFSIPDGVIIDEILVEYEGKTASGSVQMTRGLYRGDGTQINPAGSIYFNTTEAYKSLDFFPSGWTDTDINTSSFGAYIQSAGTPTDTISVDHIRITVYYTGPGTISGVQSITGIQSIIL